jgi:hypothetical protein
VGVDLSCDGNEIIEYVGLNIHGDNIVECERAFILIQGAWADDISDIEGPFGSVVCPKFNLSLKGRDAPLEITFFPGFGRWNHDILASIRERGGSLREAADVVVTALHPQEETPLFAIEFCGALPAGNQAWQRSGRAFSFGEAQIPYLYISELGGFELDSKRQRKAPRMPNPAVPFSYLSFSIEKDTPVFPIFITSPGADQQSRTTYADVFGDDDLLNFIRATLLSQDQTAVFESLQKRVLSFIKKRASSARAGETLSPEQWSEAYTRIKRGEAISPYLLEDVKQSWSKTAYIDALTQRAKSLIALGKKHGTGLTSTKLPMCLLSTSKRQMLTRDISALYPNMTQQFLDWLRNDRPLAICWVMGFKPRGDDARPDRGLPPLARMLVGSGHDLLSIVYGPAPRTTWALLANNPGRLAAQNGLWEAILETSDAVLIESATDDVSANGYTSDHWIAALPTPTVNPFLVMPVPTKLGENDVDTALHLLLAHLSDENVFEGMCNPPGGDWSGVSIIDEEAQNELRWISLPRVSGENTKRPDHVFQISRPNDRPIILSIESKETPATLEENIGPRLTLYLNNLFGFTASIQRRCGSKEWRHSQRTIDQNDYVFASAGAFISDNRSEIGAALKKSNSDIIFGVAFNASGTSCTIHAQAGTALGKEIAAIISAVDASSASITTNIIA